jgi:hypothetical protein
MQQMYWYTTVTYLTLVKSNYFVLRLTKYQCQYFQVHWFPPQHLHLKSRVSAMWRHISIFLFPENTTKSGDHLCGPVVRVLAYRSRGPGFDSRRYQIFWEVVGLERGPLSLVSTTEELLGRKSSGSGLESQNTAVRIRHADYVAPSIRNNWH